jgi:drug/metabolite transporter (DMT)-like permease
MNRPILLLLGTGAALGCYFPLGRLAGEAGINPALWAIVICLGAGLTMAAIARAAEGPGGWGGMGRYAFTSGFISNVVPHVLTYAVIPHIGSGLTAVMFALSPVTTALLSILFKVRPPTPLGLAGIGIGLAGALLIILARNSNLAAGHASWIMVAVLIPVFLGSGNVYRTLAWPKGAGPMMLASLTNLAAVPPLIVAFYLLSGGFNLAPLLAVPLLVLVQVGVSTTMFVMFFRLQQIGGPTYLSQIGYVAAAVGVAIGVTVFGETYPALVWAGVAVVAGGIALTTLAAIREARRAAER